MGWQWAGLGGGAMAGHLQLQLHHYAPALVVDSNNLTVEMLLSRDLPYKRESRVYKYLSTWRRKADGIYNA
jgi:hypothetical protein